MMSASRFQHIPARSAMLLAPLGVALLLSGCGGSGRSQDNSAAAQPADSVNADMAANQGAMVDNAVASAASNAADNQGTSSQATPAAKPAEAAKTVAPAAVAKPDATKVASAGDVTHGEKVFARCQICHSVTPGKNMIGPSLHGVVGRKSATEAGFTYSSAMKQSGLVWTPAELSKFLTAPMKDVPGTHMTFAGLPSAQDRDDVIAYLATQK